MFNTIAATEQFALLLALAVTKIPDDYDLPDTGANSLSTVQGWLDLMQMAAVCIAWSGLYVITIFLSRNYQNIL